MKKISLIASLLLVMNTMISQNKDSKEAKPMIDTEVKGKQVPSKVLDRFKSEYPNEQPTWSQDNGIYRAMFVEGSKMRGQAVGYNKSGNAVYREQRIDSTAQPVEVANYFTAKYPGYRYELWSSTDKAGKRRYYSNHNLETLWFDENGKYTGTTKARN